MSDITKPNILMEDLQESDEQGNLIVTFITSIRIIITGLQINYNEVTKLLMLGYEVERTRKQSDIQRTIICHRFIKRIRRNRNIDVLDEMLKEPPTLKNTQDKIEKSIDSLEDYIASLNVDQSDLDSNHSYSDQTLDLALGTHWKLEVNCEHSLVLVIIVFLHPEPHGSPPRYGQNTWRGCWKEVL